MMRTTACVIAFTLVNGSLGEQSLRGQPRPQGLLALENDLHSLLSMKQPNQVMRDTDHKEFGLMNESEILFGWLLWLALYVPIACFYFVYVRYHVEDLENMNAREGKRSADEHRKSIKEKYHDDGDNHLRQFSSGLFSCHKKLPITFWSFCCPGIRASDTYDKLGIFRFWMGFWITTALYCISFIPYATIICQLMVVMFMTYHRQEIRKSFEFEDQGGITWVTDCFTNMCCMCCALAQEARHTRLACIMEHKAIHIWPETAPEEEQ